MKPGKDPLDRDGDGHKGGSLPHKTEQPKKQVDPSGVEPTELPGTSIHHKPNADSPEPQISL